MAEIKIGNQTWSGIPDPVVEEIERLRALLDVKESLPVELFPTKPKAEGPRRKR